ncbi:hypothetical protein [Streptomyces pseudogriseolus]|uniref:hypothetical protein n=1 Tax=Streptomyces pseudogriseolus TaxID=36817 RepID=UPI0034942609
MEYDYRHYAEVFLPPEVCDAAVEDTFAILWLSWDDALASPDTRRYAWKILRATVMAKATYRDNLPEMQNAVFDTVALRGHRSAAGRAAQLTESLGVRGGAQSLPGLQAGGSGGTLGTLLLALRPVVAYRMRRHCAQAGRAWFELPRPVGAGAPPVTVALRCP